MKTWSNKCAAAHRRYAIEFVSHWFYNIIGFGRRALPAPVVELGRWALTLSGSDPFSSEVLRDHCPGVALCRLNP